VAVKLGTAKKPKETESTQTGYPQDFAGSKDGFSIHGCNQERVEERVKPSLTERFVWK
jgi:hypothetical protein